VKTQLSGNSGRKKPWPEKWPGRRRRKRIIIGRFFLVAYTTKLMNMQLFADSILFPASKFDFSAHVWSFLILRHQVTHP
jgi:hypothetical protein